MEMTLWRIELRGVGLTKEHRNPWSFVVATKSSVESSALELARSLYSPSWWKENIIQDIVEIGRLKAAEGLELPQEEADY